MKSLYTKFYIENSTVEIVANFLYLNKTLLDADLQTFYINQTFLNQLCTLYGFTLPIDSHQAVDGTQFSEVLYTSIYLYKFGSEDNFYERNFLNFFPEYDRDIISDTPKINLTLQSIGRAMDKLESKIAHMSDLLSIDDCPEELLEYLGQLLGYEKEDITLSDFSFRELLNNIIEIYQIKGTNYSFSFFFKFLGFEINLKEFYFNRDVKNPESFPGATPERVEYHLTTTSPLAETIDGIPQAHLDQTKNLNDWGYEQTALVNNGCTNPTEYMLGFQAYNNMGTKYHANPWRYFKANLIEYQLTPFINKLNLTASDNETIMKYINFLSPAYLFTWINVYLNPWIETIDLITDEDDSLTNEKRLKMTIINSLGYWEGGYTLTGGVGKYIPYEPMKDYLALYDPKGEVLTFNIFNNMNIGGNDRIGTYLRHDGTHIRKPDSPNSIGLVYHSKVIRNTLDRLNLYIRNINIPQYDGTVATVAQLPLLANDGDIFHVTTTNQVMKYNIVYYTWKLYSSYVIKGYVASFKNLSQLLGNKAGDIYEVIEEGAYYIYDAVQMKFVSYVLPGLTGTVILYASLSQLSGLVPGNIYFVSGQQLYYEYTEVPANWVDVSLTLDIFKYFNDYSYRTYPDVPNQVYPINYSTIHDAAFRFAWNAIDGSYGYHIQVARDLGFTNVVLDQQLTNNLLIHDPFDNDFYYWRVNVLNSMNNYIGWSQVFRFTLIETPFPYQGETLKTATTFITPKYTSDKFSSVSFTIAWDRLDDAELYLIDIYSTNTLLSNGTYGDKLIISKQLQTTSLPVTLINGTYSWRMRYTLRGTGAISDKYYTTDYLYVNGTSFVLNDNSQLMVSVNYVISNDFTVNFSDL
jgi:hypothetical protein